MTAALGVAQFRADNEPALNLHTAFSVWEFSTLISAVLIWVAAGYLYYVWKIWREHPARPWPVGRTLSFLAGLAVIAIATQSSIGAYDDVLFSIHMWQHLLLLMVAPPLLLVGQPITLVLHATHNPTHTIVKKMVRSRVASFLTCPLVGAPLYVVTVVATHLTNFMNLTLTHPLLHDAEHIVYLGVGYLYFLPLIGHEPIRWRLSVPTRFVLLVLAMPVDTFTGVVLSQANRELFPAYAGRRTWGPSLVSDIHAGGAVMWIGGDAIMLVLIGTLCVSVLRGRTTLDAGRWMESARANRFDDLASPAGGDNTVRQIDTNTDEDDERLDAYNAYLARLAGESPAVPGEASGNETRRLR